MSDNKQILLSKSIYKSDSKRNSCKIVTGKDTNLHLHLFKILDKKALYYTEVKCSYVSEFTVENTKCTSAG